MRKALVVLAGLVCSTALLPADAQKPDVTGGTAVASEPGKAAAVRAIKVTAQVVAIDKATRTLTLKGRDGNTVDVYYALTDTAELATDGFIPIGAGLTAAGTLRVPRPCPQGDGPLPFVTVKVVANGATASLSAYYWGL